MSSDSEQDNSGGRPQKKRARHSRSPFHYSHQPQPQLPVHPPPHQPQPQQPHSYHNTQHQHHHPSTPTPLSKSSFHPNGTRDIMPGGSPSPLDPSSSASAPPSPNLRPLSLSILGVEPIDEFIREVADFIHHMISTRPDMGTNGSVEVEAKVGVLRDKVSGQRLQLPVLIETILTPGVVDSRFESNMSPSQHKHFNTILNQLKTHQAIPTGGPPSSLQQPASSSASPLEYTHLHLIDTFYPSSAASSSEGSHGRNPEKIRVTRDEKTGTVLACVQKVRLGNLDVYSPKRAADWRISVNLEIPVPPPLGTAMMTRKKDRMSYSHEEFTIDLTQVASTTGPHSKPEILHELELEFTRSDYLLRTASQRGDPSVSELERNAFDELIRAFVNNARILVRNAMSEGS